MTRQYCGARYVPLIDGEWDPNKPYEPLTIVTYYGNSYTSKVAVPAGTLPTDTAYWAKTGNFNAQLEQVEKDVAQNTADIDLIQKHTTKRGTALMLCDDMASSTLSPFLSSVQQGCEPFFDKFTMQLIPGLGFAPSLSNSLANIMPNFAYENPNEVNELWLYMGVNDFYYITHGGNANDLTTSRIAGIRAAQAKFPQATIHLLCNGSNPADKNNTYTIISQYDNCYYYGVENIINFFLTLYPQVYWVNGTLAANGYNALIINTIVSVLEGEKNHNFHFIMDNVGLGNNVTSLSNENFLVMNIDDLNVFFTINFSTVTFTQPIAHNNFFFGAQEICSFKNIYGFNMTGMTPISYILDTGGQYWGMGLVEFHSNGQFLIRSLDAPDDAITGIKTVQILDSLCGYLTIF